MGQPCLFEPPPRARAQVRPHSVLEGRDPDALRLLLGFYARPPGPVLDVTANRRRMWRGLDTAGVVFCDLDPAVRPDVVCDFRRLPFADGSASAVVFDPPHLPAAAASARSLPQMGDCYGLAHGGAGDSPHGQWFGPFLREAARVLRPGGLVFCKLIDFVHNHRYQWVLADFVGAARATPGLTPCDLLVKRDPCGGNLKSGRWRRSHHLRRCHCWWAVVRKGLCEPARGSHRRSRASSQPTSRAGEQATQTRMNAGENSHMTP